MSHILCLIETKIIMPTSRYGCPFICEEGARHHDCTTMNEMKPRLWIMLKTNCSRI